MKILFVHQNFPGQYLHLAKHLAAVPGNEVVFITQRDDVTLPNVKMVIYRPQRPITPGVHHYLREAEASVLNAQNVMRGALELQKSGFVPDVMLAHNGWGELWYLKDVFPRTPLIGYFEFFYHLKGADVGFDPKARPRLDDAPRIRTKNIGNLLALDAVDLGQCPTAWQKSLYPAVYQSKLHLVHEGIDTDFVVPADGARFTIPGTAIALDRDDEVLTYVARNLEPYRGFPEFMRSLPGILERRPQARVLIVGGDDTSYGPGPAGGGTFRELMLKELAGSLDLDRVHFLGQLPYAQFLRVLQISRVHVYLSYPFVLSWSMLEAMAAGCLIVGSATAPVQEVIRDGENGLLVDFFSTTAIAERVAEGLARRDSFKALREAARRTVVEHYDLRRICLPAQLAMLDMARGQ
jgi:glycosyltransferase involved in cell wall biosynthesis